MAVTSRSIAASRDRRAIVVRRRDVGRHVLWRDGGRDHARHRWLTRPPVAQSDRMAELGTGDVALGVVGREPPSLVACVVVKPLWAAPASMAGVRAAIRHPDVPGAPWSIYGATWRRIARALSLPPTTAEHEYPPRFAQTLGSVALILSLVAFALGTTGDRLGPRLCRRRTPVASGGHGVLPRVPPVFPALVGSGRADPDLDARRGARHARAAHPGADPVPLRTLG